MARRFILIPGRWIPAWTGGPRSYRGSPRLAFQIGPNGWWRIDCFGRVWSQATVRHRNG